MDHGAARAVIMEAWQDLHGSLPSPQEAQAMQAMAWLESGYGRRWSGACSESRNWGSVQASRPPCGPGTCEYQDRRSDGSVYRVCFRSYETDVEGATNMIGVALRTDGARKAAAAGDLRAFSEALFRAGYYEGIGATERERIDGHYKALRGSARLVARELDEPLYDAPSATQGGAAWVLGGALLIGAMLWRRAR